MYFNHRSRWAPRSALRVKSSHACVAEEKAVRRGVEGAGEMTQSESDFFTYITHNSLKSHHPKK
jgi:hypothetical protein